MWALTIPSVGNDFWHIVHLYLVFLLFPWNLEICSSKFDFDGNSTSHTVHLKIFLCSRLTWSTSFVILSKLVLHVLHRLLTVFEIFWRKSEFSLFLVIFLMLPPSLLKNLKCWSKASLDSKIFEQPLHLSFFLYEE